MYVHYIAGRRDQCASGKIFAETGRQFEKEERPINLHMDIVSLSKMVLAGCHQGVLDGFKQGLLADLLLLLQNVQCLH